MGEYDYGQKWKKLLIFDISQITIQRALNDLQKRRNN